ncbi:hypothetical protein OH540_25195 [Streptomyces sp. BPPL-273]|uniref:hypothetical protein n=1 Tax=Streptomyces sp. BPPL-273 TaxID=2987533 RepID=UPI0024AF0A5E|nr:hypothetical protein [Streptomyces sp. BPPL-273]WHM33153.1 hypothetical protein OH540_25195 [Streptomyces sp. BPPL-273]
MTPTWLQRRGDPQAHTQKPAPAPDPTPAPGPDPARAGDPASEADPAGKTPPRDAAPETAPAPLADPAEDPVPDHRPHRGRLRQALLVVVVAALVLGGCGLFYAAHRVTSAAPARNHALTDTEATSRVAGDVGNALARIFSYTPDGTAAAERSARTVLDGRAARQYETLFARVRDDLTEQRVTLSTRAVRTGVIELDGDEARLLVFLDQTSRRGDGKGGTTTAAAQLTVTARLQGDHWRITDLKAR